MYFSFTSKYKRAFLHAILCSRRCIEYTLPSCQGHEYPVPRVTSEKNLLPVGIELGTSRSEVRLTNHLARRTTYIILGRNARLYFDVKLKYLYLFLITNTAVTLFCMVPFVFLEHIVVFLDGDLPYDASQIPLISMQRIYG